MLIISPMFVYSTVPQAIVLNSITRDNSLPKPTAASKLAWFQKSTEEKFFGIPTKEHATLNSGKVYLAPNQKNADFYDAGKSYLVTPTSGLGQFINKHPTEITVTPATIAYSNSQEKYQVVPHTDQVLEVNKTNNSKQTILLHLSTPSYEAFLQQAKQNPKLKRIITAEDPNTHTVTLDPTAKKIDVPLMLKQFWDYLKDSVKLENIFNKS